MLTLSGIFGLGNIVEMEVDLWEVLQYKLCSIAKFVL
jgi:hypothetical protein